MDSGFQSSILPPAGRDHARPRLSRLQGRRSPRPQARNAALGGPRDGRRSAQAVPRGQDGHRPADPGRVLLRFRRFSSFHTRGPGEHRGADAGGHLGLLPFRARGTDPERCRGTVRRPALQAGAHRGTRRVSGDFHLPAQRVRRPLPGTTRGKHRRDTGHEAAQRRRGLLAGRREAPHATAHLRHGV